MKGGKRSKQIVVGAFALLLAVCGAIWGGLIWSEFRSIRLQGELAQAVKEGDPSAVITLLDKLDPEGMGTAQEWTGGEGGDRPGFVWLMSQWRAFNHVDGAVPLFERWVSIDPAFSRDELVNHLRWLWQRDEAEHFERLLSAIYSHDLEWSKKSGSEDFLLWVSVATCDLEMALKAWELHRASGVTSPLPEALIGMAVSPESLSRPEVLERVLGLTGLLDPPESFSLQATPWKTSSHPQQSWVDWFFDQFFREHENRGPFIRENFANQYFPEAGPETPGLFLLRQLAENADETRRSGISADQVAAALDHLDRIPHPAKSDVAAFLAHHIVVFRSETKLREWVWAHHQTRWEEQRNQYQSLSSGEHSKLIKTPLYREWVQEAVKLDHAAKVAPILVQLWRHQTDEIASGRHRTPYLPPHPFDLAKHYGTSRFLKDNGSDPATFGLLLELARHPELFPSERLPWAEVSASSAGNRGQLWSLPIDEFVDFLEDLGTLYQDDPVRFVLVPTFKQFGSNFQSGEEMAAFQKRVKQNDSPGSWLAKEVAEYFTLEFFSFSNRLESLLQAGGDSPSLRQFNSYFNDGRAPVSARMAFALEVLPWHLTAAYHPSAPRVRPDLPIIRPDLDQLTLEFAKEFAAGRWPEEIVSPRLNLLIENWLHPDCGSQSNAAISMRAEARELVQRRLESRVPEKIALASSLLKEKETNLGFSVHRILYSHALVLQSEGRGEELVQFYRQLKGTLEEVRPVFPWVPKALFKTGDLESHLAAETWIHSFRESGALTVPLDHPGTTAGIFGVSMAEATTLVPPSDWMAFCDAALRLQAQSGPADQRNRFHAMAPSALLRSPKDETEEERIEKLLKALSQWTLSSGNESFYRLALPSFFRQVLKTPATAERLKKVLEAESTPGPPDVIRESLLVAADTGGGGLLESHLSALRDPAIPLAQRWLAANYFLIAWLERSPGKALAPEDWTREDLVLVETAVDLLVDGVHRGLPVWEIADRGLGEFDAKRHQKMVVLASFRNLVTSYPEPQSERTRTLLESGFLEALTRGPGGELCFGVLHSLAVVAGDQEAADRLFASDPVQHGLAGKIKILNAVSDWVGLAHLLTREWRQLETLRPEDGIWFREEALPKVVQALPDDPDLRLLVEVALLPLKPGAWYGSNPTVEDPQLVSLKTRFLNHAFSAREMERFCLIRLNPRVHSFPAFEAWIHERIQELEWEEVLNLDARSFEEIWPYRAKWIELLVDQGDYDALAEILPSQEWFEGAQRSPTQLPEGDGDTREEMVWMGFARVLAQSVSSGSLERRGGSAELIAKLLERPPVLNGSSNLKPLSDSTEQSKPSEWGFHAMAVQHLSELGLVGTLIGTLDDPMERVLRKLPAFELPMRTQGPLRAIHGRGVDDFMNWVVFLSQGMEVSRRDELYLRAFETTPFHNNRLARQMPLYYFHRYPGSPSVPDQTLLRLAKIRLESDPESAEKMSDYGLMLHFTGKSARSLEWLEKAKGRLDENDPGQSSLFREVAPLIEEIKKAVRRP